MSRPRVILITGASRGIGRALCLEARARGYEVHAVVRRADQAPPGTQAHVADVRDRAAVKALMRELAPRLDDYVANAGLGDSLNPRKEETADKAAELLDVNVTATIHSIYALAYEWIRLGLRDRRIGVVSSLAAWIALPKTSVYSASKAAELTACLGLDYDLGRNGIRISAIQPGFIDTEMSAGTSSRPFLISAEEAARRILDGMERGKLRIIFPLGTAIFSWLAAHAPDFLLRPLVRFLDRRGWV